MHHKTGRSSGLLEQRRAAVSIMFAGMAIPLVLTLGLAVDYSFYSQAQAELGTAADAAVMHAVRVASSQLVAGQTLQQAIAAGNLAGQQWWDAQIGTYTGAKVLDANVNVANVAYNASTGTFTDSVTYTGTVPTHVVASSLTGHGFWNIGGGAGASISASSYSEITMLVDNSSSMLIGATPADIIALEQLTICAPTATAIAANQGLTGTYAWNFTGNVGYGSGKTIPAKNSVNGSCDPNFTGGSAQCQSPQSYAAIDSAGFCPTGTGIPDTSGRIDPTTHLVGNIPQAPCGFACHTGDGTHDYYTLARTAANPPTLRFDVIQTAMANVVATMQTNEKISDQFALGVYQFNSGVSQVYPTPGGNFNEADTDLNAGASNIKAITTPVVADAANTNFPGAIQYLAANLAPAGDGTSPSKRKKNMFIVTDGLEDFSPTARTIGPMTTINPEPYCSQLKTLGFNIYVLYTPYYPLPNEFYLNNGPRQAVEPVSPPAASNPVIAALQACASLPTQYYQASDSASINAAMQNMVQSAIASPGRITN